MAEKLTPQAKWQQKVRPTRLAKLREMLGGKCVECGITEGLQFDHINPKDKLFEINPTVDHYAWKRLVEEIKKCQLLCLWCHSKKSVVDRGQQLATHGTATMYKHYRCRCDKCREANTVYCREWQTKRRLAMV